MQYLTTAAQLHQLSMLFRVGRWPFRSELRVILHRPIGTTEEFTLHLLHIDGNERAIQEQLLSEIWREVELVATLQEHGTSVFELDDTSS